MSVAEAACDADRPDNTALDRYILSAGEAYDKQTGLTWQRCSVGQAWRNGEGCVGSIKRLTWKEAMKQGSGGWRVPTKDELQTLVSPTCNNPAINAEVFPGRYLAMPWYWSSTENGSELAWYVSFFVGYVYYDGYRTAGNAVRLVRGK